jgi:magnesium-transporting ATPase (P-type)
LQLKGFHVAEGMASLKGLTAAEVTASRKEYGANRVTERKRRGFFRRLLENFGDPMIKILLIALAINVLFLFNKADWIETAGIAAAVLLAVLISTLSEQGSESAFRRLQEEASRVKCRVMRDGGLLEIPVEEAVIGDIIRLQPGDRVPADGRLEQGRVELDQSAVNGETKEARKAVGENCLAGTVVVSGEGFLRVTAVGDGTIYGQIAHEVQEEKGESPLKARLSQLAKTISRFGYAGAALVALAYLFNNRVWLAFDDFAFVLEKLLHAATLAVTVIVVAVPEGQGILVQLVKASKHLCFFQNQQIVPGQYAAKMFGVLFYPADYMCPRNRH